MEKDTSRNTLYKSLADCLGSTWTVRRISNKKNSWFVEEWSGSAGYGSDGLEAATSLQAIIGAQGIENEILILLATHRSLKDCGTVNIGKQAHRFERYIKAIEHVSSGSFFIAAVGMSSESLTAKVARTKDWKKMLDSAPEMARQIGESVHLLFGGSTIDAMEIEDNLRSLVSVESLIGEYASLSKIVSPKVRKAEPYQVKLAAMGLDPSSVSALRTHMDSISDSDVKESLLKTLLAMPWRQRVQVVQDIKLIRQRLDYRLFGMEEAKQEVIAAIAGAMISSSGIFRPPRILLHGKPGTGKTAMAKAIAESLNLPFQSVSMNGISTSVSIVGLEPVWRNPQPGRIIQSILNAEAMNPLLLLDEIEKCGRSGEHGSPLDALLQALDPVQNRSFRDLFLGIPVDISEIFFIATANDISGLPDPLLDRFILVEVAEYTIQDKLAIMPFLLAQIADEYELVQVPKLGDALLNKLEMEVLPHAGLRQIKNTVWRIICDEAMHCENIEEFKSSLEIVNFHSNTLMRKKEGQTSIGFL